jgi:hypothetical protein
VVLQRFQSHSAHVDAMATGVAHWEGRNRPCRPSPERALASARLAHQNFAPAESWLHPTMANQTPPRALNGEINLRPCPYPCCALDRQCCGCCARQ